MKEPLGILVKSFVRKQQYGHRSVDTAIFSSFDSSLNRTDVLTAENVILGQSLSILIGQIKRTQPADGKKVE